MLALLWASKILTQRFSDGADSSGNPRATRNRPPVAALSDKICRISYANDRIVPPLISNYYRLNSLVGEIPGNAPTRRIRDLPAAGRPYSDLGRSAVSLEFERRLAIFPVDMALTPMLNPCRAGALNHPRLPVSRLEREKAGVVFSICGEMLQSPPTEGVDRPKEHGPTA